MYVESEIKSHAQSIKSNEVRLTKGTISLSGITLKSMELIVSKSSGGSNVSLEKTSLGPVFMPDGVDEKIENKK